MTGRALWADPNSDLGPEDLEKAFYACMTQVDLWIEAVNAKMSVEQLVAAKKAEAEAEAAASRAVETEAASGKAAEAEDAGMPAAQLRPADKPVVSTKDMKAPVVGAKRLSGSGSVLSTKRTRRKKPESLGMRDG